MLYGLDFYIYNIYICKTNIQQRAQRQQPPPQERHTAKAMAYRIHEALERGSAVLIADIGRPNRLSLTVDR